MQPLVSILPRALLIMAAEVIRAATPLDRPASADEPTLHRSRLGERDRPRHLSR